MVLKALFTSLCLLMGLFLTASAQTAAPATDSSAMVAGKWTGSFEGSSSGKFELMINQDSNHKLAGQIVMLAPDGNRYPIDLKTIVWQNNQLKASYTDPQGGDDVNFSGKYDSANLKGTWETNGGQATGTWQLAKADK